MTEHNTQHRFNDDSINIETLADAQDGSEILFAVAQLLESQHGKDYGYALLLRSNATPFETSPTSYNPGR